MLFKLRIHAADLAAGRAARRPHRRVGRARAAGGDPVRGQAAGVCRRSLLRMPSRRSTRLPMRLPDCANLGAPSLVAVPDENWVALSQAALPPVRCRPLRRARQPRPPALREAGAHAIEIEAGEAFGTGPQRHDRALPRGHRPAWRAGGATGASSIWAAAPACWRSPRRAHFPAPACWPSTTTRSPPPWRAPTRASTASPPACASSTPRASTTPWCVARSPSIWCSPTSSPTR